MGPAKGFTTIRFTLCLFCILFMASLWILPLSRLANSRLSSLVYFAHKLPDIQPDPISPELFSSVFVVSLPHRQDRRSDMERLRNSLSLDWTYINATPAHSPAILQIMKELRSTRESARSSSSTRFSWPFEPTNIEDQLNETFMSAPPSNRLHTFSESSVIEEISFDPLTCAVEDFASGPLYNRSMPSHLQLTLPKIACWESHLQVIQRIVSSQQFIKIPTRSNGTASLVLEDDVDMEFDIMDRLQQLWPLLPSDWDIVFLGHCWSDETFHPFLRPPAKSTTGFNHSSMTPEHTLKNALHPSHSPKCTHGYALSPKGARNILRHLVYPPFAHSRALDQAFSWLVQSKRLKSFSVVPSLVVQRKVATSDIEGGRSGLGSKWRETLEHGILGNV